MGAQMENTHLIDADEENHSITIDVPGKVKFLFDQINNDNFKQKLSNYINTFWGEKYNVRVKLSDAPQATQNLTPKAIKQQVESDKKQKTLEQINNHPLVQSNRNIFKSEIKSVKEQL